MDIAGIYPFCGRLLCRSYRSSPHPHGCATTHTCRRFRYFVCYFQWCPYRDLVMPVSTGIIHWDSLISRSDFKQADSSCQWISMGWGDKGFYLNTPTWDDLTFGTAFKAVFYLSTTAMHVQYGKQAPFDKIYCRQFVVSKQHYAQLMQYVLKSFAYDKNGKVILLPNEGYWDTDRFYDAVGKYGFTQTCNTWTNRGLKIAGKQTGVWTAFESGIREQFD